MDFLPTLVKRDTLKQPNMQKTSFLLLHSLFLVNNIGEVIEFDKDKGG